MSIRNVSFARIEKTTIGGAGNGNSYNFKVRYEVEVGPKGSDVWTEITTLAHGERDVASSFESAGQEVPGELRGPYDCYGRIEGEAKRAFEDGLRDGALEWSTSNEWTMSKHIEHYAAGFRIASAERAFQLKTGGEFPIAD